MLKLRMGTRGSALALAQSGWVVKQLQALEPGLEVETVVIKTSGDLFGAISPKEAQALASGTKGLFVKEIEEALSRGDVDFAVHSAKDLPSALADGLSIAAYPQREDPRDVFIGRPGVTWENLKPGMKVATSSLRRVVQLQRVKPGVLTAPMRGNVDTRLKKLASEGFDGLILAAAGLKRLGRTDVRVDPIHPEVMVPSPGQGALAVETRDGESPARALIARFDHAATRAAVELERGFLAKMGGGCSTPLGAHAQMRETSARFSVFYSHTDGSRAVRFDETCVDLARGESFVTGLVSRVRKGA